MVFILGLTRFLRVGCIFSLTRIGSMVFIGYVARIALKGFTYKLARFSSLDVMKILTRINLLVCMFKLARLSHMDYFLCLARICTLGFHCSVDSHGFSVFITLYGSLPCSGLLIIYSYLRPSKLLRCIIMLMPQLLMNIRLTYWQPLNLTPRKP